jgi:serine/threonine protein kinase
MKYEIVKFLHETLFGSLYLVIYEERYYIAKISRLRYSDAKISKGGSRVLEDIENEINAVLYINNKFDLLYPGVDSPFVNYIEESLRTSHHQYIMEYCGPDMLTVINDPVLKLDFDSTAKGKNNIKRVCHELAKAVKFLKDNGISHCDLSLENICYNNGRVKIIDFGVAMIHPDFSDVVNIKNYMEIVDSTEGRFICEPCVNIAPGKHMYHSPEVYLSKMWDAYANDVFSLGCIFYLIITKYVPYEKKLSHNYDLIMSGEWLNLKDTMWYLKDCDPLGLDLVNKMLKFENERLTIEQVLEHDWFK